VLCAARTYAIILDVDDLTKPTRALLHRILGNATFAGAEELRSQVARASVSGGPATMLELEVTGTRSTMSDGVIPIRALVLGPDGPSGELLVWVSGGYLSALEYAWFTDQSPVRLPDPEDLAFDPASADLEDNGAGRWVERLCQVPEALQAGNLAIRAAFRQADPDLTDRVSAMALIRRHLSEKPHLVDAWQKYSYDKRSSPSPYLDQTEVGFYDHGYEDVDKFDNRADACAEFVFREAAWVLGKYR
jgi:hypothetical protein